MITMVHLSSQVRILKPKGRKARLVENQNAADVSRNPSDTAPSSSSRKPETLPSSMSKAFASIKSSLAKARSALKGEEEKQERKPKMKKDKRSSSKRYSESWTQTPTMVPPSPIRKKSVSTQTQPLQPPPDPACPNID